MRNKFDGSGRDCGVLRFLPNVNTFYGRLARHHCQPDQACGRRESTLTPIACSVIIKRKLLPTFFGPALWQEMYGPLPPESHKKCPIQKMPSFETLHSHQPQPTLSLSWKTGLCLLGPFGMLGTSSSLKDTKIIHLTFSIQHVLSSRNTNKSHCAADSSHHSRVTLSILMIFRYGLILIQLLCFLHYCLLELRAHDLYISYYSIRHLI